MESEVFAKIFERVADSFANYFKRLRERENSRWEQIFFALNEAKNLTDLHMNAVKEVVDPIIKSDDFLTTYERFAALVNNKNFPDQYGAIKGTLLSAYENWPEFKKEPNRTHLNMVINDIVRFQAAVFMRKYRDLDGNIIGEDIDSWKVADYFLKIKELFDILSTRNQNKPVSEADLDKENRIKDDLRPLYTPGWTIQFLPQESLRDMEQARSRKDLVEVVKTWCRGWQRYVQNELFVEGRLTYSINLLKADRYK